MHHWHWHRPSRLLWFVLGGVTGAWFMRYKQCSEAYRVRHCSRPSIPQEAYPAPAPGPSVSMDERWREQWLDRFRPQQEPQQSTEPSPVTDALKRPHVVVSDGWEEERQRLMNIKQQATNSLLDFSEESIDSLLTNMESLKSKLAERRTQRDKEARERAEREADFQAFQEWKSLKAAQEKEVKDEQPAKKLV